MERKRREKLFEFCANGRKSRRIYSKRDWLRLTRSDVNVERNDDEARRPRTASKRSIEHRTGALERLMEASVHWRRACCAHPRCVRPAGSRELTSES